MLNIFPLNFHKSLINILYCQKIIDGFQTKIKADVFYIIKEYHLAKFVPFSVLCYSPDTIIIAPSILFLGKLGDIRCGNSIVNI